MVGVGVGVAIIWIPPPPPPPPPPEELPELLPLPVEQVDALGVTVIVFGVLDSTIMDDWELVQTTFKPALVEKSLRSEEVIVTLSPADIVIAREPVSKKIESASDSATIVKFRAEPPIVIGTVVSRLKYAAPTAIA